MEDVSTNREETPVAPKPPARRRGLRRLGSLLWENSWLLLLGIIGGLAISFLLNQRTAVSYEAQGQFLVGELPFLPGTAQTLDSDTSRQLVRSLILSIPSEDLRRALAEQLNIAPTNLAFADRERPLSSRGEPGKRQANIHIAPMPNTRLGLVTVRSGDREFALEVVNAVLDQVTGINAVAGEIHKIDSDVRATQMTLEELKKEVAQAAAERMRLEKQCRELEEYLQRQPDIAAFPAFASDATVNHLRAQLITASLEYENLARSPTQSNRLEGKRAEMESLRQQISEHAQNLARGLHASLDLSRVREDSLQNDLQSLNARLNTMAERRAHLVRALADAAHRSEIRASSQQDGGKAGTAITIVDPARIQDKPAPSYPHRNLLIGALLGLGLGLALALNRFLWDDRVRDSQELEKAGLPVLGTPSRNRFFRRRNGAEAQWFASHFLRRQLLGEEQATTLAFVGLGRRVRSVSFVADLARELGRAGKKVLIIDLGSSRARLARRLGITQLDGHGIWDGRQSPTRAKVTAPDKSVSLLSLAQDGGNPHEKLLRRPPLDKIRTAQAKYDFIFFHADSRNQIPTLLLTAPPETAMIGLARYKRTRLEQVRQFAEISERENLRHPGVLLVL